MLIQNQYNFNITNSKRNYVSTPPILNVPKSFNNDIFEHTKTINFNGTTSRGKFLKHLTGIRDPYSDVVILTEKQMEKIKIELDKCDNIRQKVRVLNTHKESMLPVEKSIFKIFELEAKKDKQTDFSKILRNKKNTCITKLQNEQQQIFDQIETVAETISPARQAKIKAELAEGRERILREDTDKHHFKRKSFIYKIVRHQQYEILDKIEEKIIQLPPHKKYDELETYLKTRTLMQDYPPDANINGKSPITMVKELQAKYIPETLDKPDEYTPIIDIAQKLPTSRNSVNAFVVKYFDRSEEEIGARILRPSVGNIEHIKPDSLGGENEAYNFMFTTQARNQERGNKPFPEFIKRYPKIPEYMQHYLDDIIESIHTGKLSENKWYPYLYKERIKEEAGVDLDISQYCISPEKAFKKCPSRLKNKYPKYSQYISDNDKHLDIKG